VEGEEFRNILGVGEGSGIGFELKDGVEGGLAR